MKSYQSLFKSALKQPKRSFSTSAKNSDGMPEFFNYYGKLFKKSMIMERILPRELNHASLKGTFPYLFTN